VALAVVVAVMVVQEEPELQVKVLPEVLVQA
jgi:hypothetical protein